MNKIKFYTALLGARLAEKALKLRGSSSATSFPGVVATKIDKSFLKEMNEFCGKSIITVTGTNGKTTTSGLVAKILSAAQNSVLHNQKGANMPQGITTALALGLNPFDKPDYFVLENDEAYLTKIYDVLDVDYLIITNLFKDQLDRYGAVDTTAKKIREAIDKKPDLKILLNADDVTLRDLYNSNTMTYGFESIEFMEQSHKENTQEILYCKCGEQLQYDKIFYSHIGHYMCPCGYKRPIPDFSACAKIYHQYTEIEVTYKDNLYNFKVNIPGLYNAYNALSALSMGLLLGISEDKIQLAFDEYHSVFGRAEKLKLKDKDVFIQLIKNPVGASEVIRTISDEKKSKLLIAMNANYADGRDLSWLWDTDFEALSDYPNKIIVSGERAYDMALRLKYTNFPIENIVIIHDIKSALQVALSSLEPGETLNILPTYTALLAMQNIFKTL